MPGAPNTVAFWNRGMDRFISNNQERLRDHTGPCIAVHMGWAIGLFDLSWKPRLLHLAEPAAKPAPDDPRASDQRDWVVSRGALVHSLSIEYVSTNQ